MNNAANEEDIRNGTSYANKIGIKVTMPKWGVSKSEYFFNKEENIIAKGLSSVKFMNQKIANELYELAQNNTYERFIDVLRDIDDRTTVNSRQLDILIKIDFFSAYGNQRELIRIKDIYTDLFKKGEAKKISRDKVDGTQLEEIISKYSVGVTKSGGVARSYTLLDVWSAMREIEDMIKTLNMSDFTDILKVRNFTDVMGYVGYVSGKEEDRRKLYVLEVYPLERKSDKKRFGYTIVTKSIGSGKEGRFTVFNKVYNEDPIEKGDIIYCQSFSKDRGYFRLLSYYKVY